jgi:hypothetical protein
MLHDHDSLAQPLRDLPTPRHSAVLNTSPIAGLLPPRHYGAPRHPYHHSDQRQIAPIEFHDVSLVVLPWTSSQASRARRRVSLVHCSRTTPRHVHGSPYRLTYHATPRSLISSIVSCITPRHVSFITAPSHVSRHASRITVPSHVSGEITQYLASYRIRLSLPTCYSFLFQFWLIYTFLYINTHFPFRIPYIAVPEDVFRGTIRPRCNRGDKCSVFRM